MAAKVLAIPAPVKGWNVRDSIADSPKDTARILDNWFPNAGRVELRPGYTAYASGLGGAVETLAEYESASVRKFIAAANGNFWDISTSTPSSLASGFSVNRWQHAQMDGKIAFVNGTDTPQTYDGTTFGNLTVSGSGLTVADLIGVNVFQGRSYFWEDGTQDFWYSAVNTLGGALTKFPLSRVGQFGGKLLTMGTWTRDSGDGLNDLAVFFMTSGETIVYSGTDPASFTLVGVFRIGAPLSIRGVIKLGGDLVVITADGYVSMNATLMKGRVNDEDLISRNINPVVIESVNQFKGNYGWQVIHYPKGNMLMFNVPVSTGTTYHQHVFNTNEGTACRFRNIPSQCWGMFNDEIYFGGSGVVYRFNVGYSDNGNVIEADAQTAATYLNNKAVQKHVKAIQPVIASDGRITISAELSADFKIPSASYKTSDFLDGPGDWDAATWDEENWSGGDYINNQWLSKGVFGYSFSTRLRLRTKGQEVKWYSINYMFENAGII